MAAFAAFAVTFIVAIVGLVKVAPVAKIGMSRGRIALATCVLAVFAAAFELAMELLFVIVGGEISSPLTTCVFAVAGVAISSAVLVLWLRHYKDLGRIVELGEALRDEDPSRRQAALKELEGLLRARAKTRRAVKLKANLDLYSATQLLNANYFEEGEMLLDVLPLERLGPPVRDLHAAAKATARLYRGDGDGARSWFARVRRPAKNPQNEAIFATTDALLAALEGRTEEALRIMGPEQELPAVPTVVDRGADHARAHVLAALGDSEGAKARLLRMGERHGRLALERAATLGGPASSIAQSILRGEDGPYR